MSAFGGKADITILRGVCPLLRSLLGVKQTWRVAAHMSASDPKRTSRLRAKSISGPEPSKAFCFDSCFSTELMWINARAKKISTLVEGIRSGLADRVSVFLNARAYPRR